MTTKFLDPTALDEAFGTLVSAHRGQDPREPLVEFATFSGDAADVKIADGCCYLRLTRHGTIDDEGKAHEMWARLAAPGGLWVVPRVETEMLVVAPGGVGVGAAWAFHEAQSPRAKVSRDQAYLDIDADTTLLALAKAFVFRASACTFGVDPTSGDFQVSFSNGTRLEVTSSAIRLVVCDATGVATAVVIDATGVTTACAPGGVPSVTHKIDGSAGSVFSKGTGTFSAQHPYGSLGLVASLGIAYGASSPSVPSATWRVQP